MDGMTVSITGESNPGGRRYQEDKIQASLEDEAFVAVFDGHGGDEAANYAKRELWAKIQKQPKFKSQDADLVSEAIKEAYVAVHHEMLFCRPSWKRKKSGDLSTAGTTACIVIFRKDIFVGNCGDSRAVMAVCNPAYGQPGEHPVVAMVLTKDHKPDDPMEKEAIKKLGGMVLLDKGTARLTRAGARTVLSVSRSLGDYWSFNPKTGKFVVSPIPDVFVYQMDLSQQVFVVLASDGLWDVMSPRDVVTFIHDYDKTLAIDVVTALIQEAISRWERNGLQADNVSVVITFLSKENTPVNSPYKNSSTASSAADTIEDPPACKKRRQSDQAAH